MIEQIEKHLPEIERLCRKYDVEKLELFGSAARADFNPSTSDIDFLVEFHDFKLGSAAKRYLGLLVDLEDLFSRRVDLVSYSAIRNPYFKQVVDRTRVSLYAA